MQDICRCRILVDAGYLQNICVGAGYYLGDQNSFSSMCFNILSVFSSWRGEASENDQHESVKKAVICQFSGKLTAKGR